MKKVILIITLMSFIFHCMATSHSADNPEEGCTDINAVNYNCLATITNNDLCIYVGCTNSNASNYDPAADYDDGSCDLVYGCTYPESLTYDSQAEIEDGSCHTYENCPFDFDNSGSVSASDLTQLLSVFGTFCD